MEQKQSLFYKLLGIITPEIISNLTTISLGANKKALSDLILGEGTEETKRPIDNVVELKVVAEQVKTDSGAESKIEENMGTSATILEVKKRLKKSQEKIKETEIYSLYKSNSLVDINQARKNREDMNKSSNVGVLVNKKQA